MRIGAKTDIHENHSIKLKLNWQYLFVSLTMLYCILFPADNINIKEIIFGITLLVCSPAIIHGLMDRKHNAMLIIYGILFPLISTLYSFTIGSSTVYDAVSNNYVWMFLFLVPAIEYYRIDIKGPFLLGTTFLIVITDIIFALDFFGIQSIFTNPIVLFFGNLNEMGYGKGIFSTFGYSIFHKALPLSILSYGYFINKKNFFMIAIYILAFAVCGTRANLLVALAILVAIPLLKEEAPSKKIIVILIIAIVALFILPDFVEYYITRSRLKTERSDRVKIEAIKSIFTFLNEDKLRYIFGSGVGSYFFSTGRNAYVNVVEVSFLDYFRQIGIFGFSFFLYFLIKPIRKYTAEYRWVIISYIGYLAVAATNPLLASSTAFMGYVILYSCAFTESPHSIL